MQELGPNQEKWLTALESGEYKKGVGVLCDETNAYCCLGVAAEIFGCVKWYNDHANTFAFDGRATSFAPDRVIDSLKLFTKSGSSKDFEGDALVTLNDDRYDNFKDIAAVIRSKPDQYFKEPS